MAQEPSSQHSSTSQSLIRRAQEADAEAWEKLVRVYSPVVYGWARKAGLQAQDASDVMQAVFETLTVRLPQFQRRNATDSFRGWLYTVTRNKVRDFFRRQHNHATAVGGTEAQLRWNELAQSPPSADSAEGISEVTGMRRRVLDLLSGDFEGHTWQAFWRTTVAGDAPADVAEDLGISVWAVYKARSRVLSKLRSEFEDLL